MSTKYGQVRGFNYQPSYASCSYEAWLWFDKETFRRELTWGKKGFPGINTVRFWLSWDAYIRAPKAFCEHLEDVLSICESLGLRAICCLFNRWHNAFCDNGGIYMERLLPGTQMYDPHFFEQYLRDVCTPHKDDPRVLIWDMCNEPYSFDCSFNEARPVERCTTAWMSDMSRLLQEIGVSQDVGISIHGSTSREMMELVEPMSTVFMIHPYLQWKPDAKVYAKLCQDVIEHLDWQVAYAESKGKGILVTECCWGSIDEEVFADNIVRTLTEYTKRNLGFVAHALAHSEVADLHAPKYGPILSDMGQFNFLDQHGNVRPGLEVFNQF